MFEIVVTPRAAKQLAALRRFDAAAVTDAVETHLRHEPERTSRSRIKRLRGSRDATFRLRIGEHRVFYDVAERRVTVIAVLHKRETAAFYRTGKEKP